MAAVNNSAPARIVGGSNSGKLQPDQVIVKALEILRNPDIGSLRTMFAKYTIKGGKFIFKTPERMIPAFYQATGGNKSQYGVVNQVEIDADHADIIKHPIETLDFDTQVLASQEEGILANSIALGIDARLDAYVLDELVKASASTITYMGGAFAGITESISDADLQKIWRKISFRANALKGKVTKNTVGVNNGNLLAIVSNNLLSLLAEYLKVYTDKNTEVFVEGSETIGFRIGNITLVSHIYLGQTLPAGSVHEKDAYDFKGVDCILLHTEAFAAVFNHAPTMWNTIDPDTGNVVIGAKYQWGSGVLRPKFIEQISFYADSTAAAASAATGTGEVISADIATTKPSTN